MSQDHLDKETSVGVELTPTGITANARSRFIAAVDRLCGNAVDMLNIPLERRISHDRAMIEAEKSVIDAVVEYGVSRMKDDPAFASRVAQRHFDKLFEKQRNKDGVVRHAIEDLRREATTPAEANEGPENLSGQFMDRLERYAEEASTEELRERWGRVLSAEIRLPGTLSAKALRIVDELDAATAQLFEQVCQLRLANVLPKCLIGELSFNDVVRLTEAGLLVDPGMGQIRAFRSVHGADNKDHWIIYLGEYALAFLAESISSNQFKRFAEASHPLVLDEEGSPAMPVYVLTETGFAVSQILPNTRRDAFKKLADFFRQKFEVPIDALEVDAIDRRYRVFAN